jgi:ribonuclease D
MFGDTPLVMIEDQEALEALCTGLLTQEIIGVDTEADSFHHYKEQLCLIQVSDPVQDYIIDPLVLDNLEPLRAVLEAPGVVKVLHGGDYDVVSLKRDYGIHIRNIFDTMIAAQFLALPRIGLADLIFRFFGYTVDKRFQRHDWTRRPLLSEHLDYARGDTHFLLALREVLSHRLRRSGHLAAHTEECELLEDRVWKRKRDATREFYRVKGSKVLKPDGLRILRSLWHFRDEQARLLDRPAFKVVPDPVLVKLAQAAPADEDALHGVIRARSSMTRRYGSKLLAAVAEGREDQTPLPPKKDPNAQEESSPRPRRSSPSMDRLLGPLKDWRNQLVSQRKVSPVVVASNQLLKEVARAAPTTKEELGEVPGIRRWQVRAYGSQLLAIVAGIPSPKKKRRRRRRKASTAPTDS